MTETGMTMSEVRNMDVADAFELMSYWARYPTVNMLARSYFNVEPNENVEELLRGEAAELLGPAVPMSAATRADIAWAEEQRKKMRLN